MLDDQNKGLLPKFKIERLDANRKLCRLHQAPQSSPCSALLSTFYPFCYCCVSLFSDPSFTALYKTKASRQKVRLSRPCTSPWVTGSLPCSSQWVSGLICYDCFFIQRVTWLDVTKKRWQLRIEHLVVGDQTVDLNFVLFTQVENFLSLTRHQIQIYLVLSEETGYSSLWHFISARFILYCIIHTPLHFCEAICLLPNSTAAESYKNFIQQVC